MKFTLITESIEQIAFIVPDMYRWRELEQLLGGAERSTRDQIYCSGMREV